MASALAALAARLARGTDVCEFTHCLLRSHAMPLAERGRSKKPSEFPTLHNIPAEVVMAKMCSSLRGACDRKPRAIAKAACEYASRVRM
mgnify:CR=1 FL=1